MQKEKDQKGDNEKGNSKNNSNNVLGKNIIHKIY